MAGAGYKLFNTGDVLTAAQVNTYLQEQTVMVFANAAARTTALASVLAEGMVSYLKDTDALEIYSGSAWVGYGSGDITGVTAGTGISGGGTSGTVTITNSMATEITAAGDIIVGTGSGTFDNLPIGTTGQILTADTSVSPYKVKWATASSTSGLTKIVSADFTTSAGVAINGCFTSTYTNYVVVINSLNAGSNDSDVYFRFQYSTSTQQSASYYSGAYYMNANNTSGNYNENNATKVTLGRNTNLARGQYTINISNVGNSSQYPTWSSIGNGANSNGVSITAGTCDSANTYTGLYLFGAANITGTYTVYGLAK